MTTIPARRILRVIPALLLLLIISGWPAGIAGQAAPRRPPRTGPTPCSRGRLRAAAEGTGGCRARAAPPQRHADEPEPGQEVVPRRDRATGPVPMKTFAQAVRRARRRVHRLQGQPLARAHHPQQRRHPADLRGRRHRRSRSRCRPARASRAPRGRPTARPSPSSCTARTRSHIWMTDVATNKPRQVTKTPLLRDARQRLRVHRRRQADRRGPDAGRPRRACRRRRPRRPARRSRSPTATGTGCARSRA